MHSEFDINIYTAIGEEIKRVLKEMRNERHQGLTTSQLTPPLLQTYCMIHGLNLHRYWIKRKFPKTGRGKSFVKLTFCGNWRRITLLTMASKVLARIVIKRTVQEINSMVSN
jgi:hypothetical protein